MASKKNTTGPDALPDESWSLSKLGEFCRRASKNLALEAWKLGHALILAKTKQPHGEWLKWLATYCPDYSSATISRYTTLARELKETDLKGVGLTTAYRRLGLLAKPEQVNGVFANAGITGKQASPFIAIGSQSNHKAQAENDANDVAAPGAEPQASVDPSIALTQKESFQEAVARNIPFRLDQLSRDLDWIEHINAKVRRKCWRTANAAAFRQAVQNLKDRLDWILTDMAQCRKRGQ